MTERLLAIVEPSESSLEIGRQGDTRHDPSAARHLDRPRRIGVERIDHGENKRVLAEVQRQDVDVAQELRRQPVVEQGASG